MKANDNAEPKKKTHTQKLRWRKKCKRKNIHTNNIHKRDDIINV